MIRVRCPTGCAALPRPYGRRTEAVRCANCRAWFAAVESAEDGSLVHGVLLARPGEPLPMAAPPRWLPRRLLVATILLVAALAAGALFFFRNY